MVSVDYSVRRQKKKIKFKHNKGLCVAVQQKSSLKSQQIITRKKCVAFFMQIQIM